LVWRRAGVFAGCAPALPCLAFAFTAARAIGRSE
jgi:hypothetical protein